MRVICHIHYEATHRGDAGPIKIKFEKGKIYDTLSEYDNCYLFLIEHDIYIIKKLYFLTLEQVAKKKLFSFNKQLTLK
jgi:hypothetical protein